VVTHDSTDVWNALGVWGLANVFANGKLCFTRDVPEQNCLPQWLEQPRVQPNLLPRWQLELAPEKVVHRAYLSVQLNMHPNRQFPGFFVVHMPLCLHPREGNRHFWDVPPGGEDAVTRRRLLFKGGGRSQFFLHPLETTMQLIRQLSSAY
jgi:hypothetical protein